MNVFSEAFATDMIQQKVNCYVEFEQSFLFLPDKLLN